MTQVLAVISAYRGEGMIGPTVRAARAIPDVDQVVVVDDGSGDETPQQAAAAGARVLISPRNRGKGGALEAALGRLAPAEAYLLLDQDVGGSAAAAEVLLRTVLDGRADLVIGVLPRQQGHGGFRLVKRVSAGLIRSLSGFRPAEPMSGQRALSARAMAAVRPLAPGFGVELGMTVDAVRAGLRVVEVPVAMTHAATGRNLAGFHHRARQGWDHLRAAASRLSPR